MLREKQDWSESAIHAFMQEFVQAEQIGFAKLGKPLRVLITGNLKSPDMALVLAALGVEKVKKRLQEGLQRFPG
jgi:glutamyl-tRNA synthetase